MTALPVNNLNLGGALGSGLGGERLVVSLVVAAGSCVDLTDESTFLRF